MMDHAHGHRWTRCRGTQLGRARFALPTGFAAVVLLLASGGMSGCEKPLLAPSEARSPYDRYDAVRAQYAPQYVEDEFGRKQPNLRGRLSPKN